VQKLKAYWSRALALASEKDIFFNASAITFNLFICSIPFVLILVSIIGYVLSYETAFDELIRYGSELIPVFSYEATETDVIEGAESLENILRPLVGARTVFGITGLLILTLFTQGLLHSLKHVIFDIFDVEDRAHPVMDAIYNFLGFGVLGALFLFFSLMISVISLFDFSVIAVPYTDIEIRLPWVYDLLDIFLPIIFTFFLVFVIYRFVSERRVSYKTSMIGAAIYTFMFELAKLMVSYYLGYAFTSYQYYYQGYAVFVVIAAWTFYSSLLFVVSVILTRAWKETYELDKSMVDENPYSALD
jgi:uncharacterized BrkB/YihY/UPF0761 family membrane protein